MERSRRGRRPSITRRRKRRRGSSFNGTLARGLAFEPLEGRTLLAASLNVFFQVDAPTPVSSLSVGEDFTLKVFVQDARANPTGVNQAYFDLAYDTSIAEVTGPVVNGADFDVTAGGNDSTPGHITDAGGLSTTFSPPSPADEQQLLFSVPMKAIGAGQFNLTPGLSANPSDAVLFFSSTSAVPVGAMNFSGTPLTVTAGPAVSSITTVDANPTDASLVHYKVNFNEPVSGVDTSDFGLQSSGIAGSTVVSVSPNSGFNSTYTVTVNAGSPGGIGTLGLNLIDGDAIVDNANKMLAGGHTHAILFTGGTYTIDRTAPAVSSIVTASSNPTNATSVDYTVTFNKSLTGIAASDFKLAANGITGAAVTNLTGSGRTFTVTVDTGSGDGTLGLNFIDGPAAITDDAGNTLAGGGSGSTLFTGQTYTIDKTPLSVNSIALVESSPTSASSVSFTVRFNKNVTGVSQGDFNLTTTGISGAAITSIAGSGSTYTVIASTGTGIGTLGLHFIDGPAKISDAAGNSIAGGDSGVILATGPSYTVDNTPVTVSSISLVDASLTHAASVAFTVSFNKVVSGVSPADFALAETGIAGASITNLTGSGATYTVTASTGSGSGSLGLNLVDASARISDLAGNTLAGGNTGAVIFFSPVYTVDKTPVGVNSIARADSNPTNAASVNFTVTFNKNVTGVNQDDFDLTATGITGAAITSVAGSGSTYTVTASTGTGDGVIGLNFIDGSAEISDAAGNTLAGGNTGAVLSTGPAYTVDKTPPAVASITTSDLNPTAAASIDFAVTFTENVTGVTAGDFALAASGVTGASIVSVSGSGADWTVTISSGTGNGTLGLDFIDGPAAIVDAAGNTLGGGSSGSTLFTGQSYTLDRTLPAVVSVLPAGSQPTNQATVDFTVTFSEGVTGVDASDFAPVANSGITGATITAVSGSGSVWTVTVGTGTGDGSLGLNVVDGDAITGSAGKILGGGNTGKLVFAGTTPYTIDKTPPSVSSITLADTDPVVAPATVGFTVTFSEAVSGVDASDFALTGNGLTGSSITSVSGSGTTWTVAAATGTGNGTLALKLIDGDAITDAAGNAIAGTHTGATIFTGPASYNVQTSVAQSAGSSTELFVVQVYRDLLHREVEPQGLQFWSNLIDGGMSRQSAVEEIEYSYEYRSDVVQGLYRLYLHRAAEPGAVSHFTNLLLHGTPEQIAILLTSSNEYFQDRGGGTNAGFLNALYNDALNRDPGSSPLAATSQLDLTRQANRVVIVDAVFGSDEYLSDLASYPPGVSDNPFHNELPFGFYQDYLGRNADDTAVAALIAEMKHGQPEVSIIARILGSNEYFARAQNQPG